MESRFIRDYSDCKMPIQISPKSNRIIKIAGLILVGLVVFIGGVILYFWFGMLKPYTERLERPRVPLLKKVAVAQAKFRAHDLDKDGIMDYATLAELVKAKLLTDEEVHKAGFVFSEPATSDPQNCWWAVVQPFHSMQGRAFFINQTGIIYVATDGLNLELRVNRKTAAVPVGMQVMK